MTKSARRQRDRSRHGRARPGFAHSTTQAAHPPERNNDALFLELLDMRADVFTDIVAPTLCHEDLNPNTLVLDMREGRPALAWVLDFESAWASTGESDLARLELWWMSAGAAVREGYLEVAPIAAGYAATRPLLQLLWCLEYAQFHNAAEDQAVVHHVCDELGIAHI